MQTKDIIKKYRQSKQPIDLKKESDLVFERLYKSIDAKFEEQDRKVAEVLNKVVLSVSDTIRKMTEYVQTLKPQKGDPGEPGKTYTLSPLDKEEISSQIKVPVVEKVIERTEVIKELPQITEITKEIENKDTPEQIIDKVNSARKKILLS